MSSDKEWAIGLYDYSQSDVINHQLYKAFYDCVYDQVGRLNVEITHVSISGSGYSGRFRKIKQKEHKKVLSANFDGILGLGLVCNTIGSDAPAYDRLVYSSLSTEMPRETMLIFTSNECLAEFGSSTFEEIFIQLLDVYPWSFGCAFMDKVSRQPDFHLLGINNSKLSKEEADELDAWYGSSQEEKMRCIRSIYPYNLVNRNQLNQSVKYQQSLSDYFRSEPDFIRLPLDRSDLELWKIDPNLVNVHRSNLKGTAATIA